ncbi:hypothetical protein QQG55_22670 [Brugia pahangi]
MAVAFFSAIKTGLVMRYRRSKPYLYDMADNSMHRITQESQGKTRLYLPLKELTTLAYAWSRKVESLEKGISLRRWEIQTCIQFRH